MLYLFNSGFAGLYRTNLLNTLFLPSGTLNTYRYGKGNLEPTLFANPNLVKKQNDCLIVFIDRYYKNGYQFIPIRKARFFDVNKDAGYLHFQVVMSDFVFPTDLVTFNETISNALRDLGLPQLTNNDPLNTGDGRYAILADHSFQESGTFDSGDDAWAKAVDEIAARQAIHYPDLIPIFAKCRLLKKNKGISPKWLFRKHFGRFALQPAKEYDVELSLRHPNYTKFGAARINLGSTDNIKWANDTSVLVDSFQNRVPIKMAPKRYPEDLTGSIHLSSENTKVLVANAQVNFVICQRYLHRFYIGLVLCAYAVTTAFIGLDLKSVQQPWSVHLVFHLLMSNWTIVVAVIVQTFSLFALFRLIGQKPI